MTAAEAVAYGVIDEVITTREAAPARSRRRRLDPATSTTETPVRTSEKGRTDRG